MIRTIPLRLPGIRVVAVLLAGRGVYRLVFYAAGLGLLTLWGPDEFARYATATGAVAWLSALLAGGAEKAALALIPRPEGTQLPRWFAVLAVGPTAVLSLGWLGVLVAGGPESVTRYAAASALTAGIGGCAVLVALYRLRGAHYRDALTYLLLAGVQAAVVGVVAVTRIDAHAVLALLVGAVVLVDFGLLAGLWRQLPAGWPARPVALTAARATVMLGSAEVLSTVSISVLYALFELVGDTRGTSLFYTLLLVSSIVSVGWAYLLRLVQPSLVSWLLRAGPTAGWRRAAQILDATLLLGLPTAVVLLVMAARAGGGLGLAVVAQAVEIFLFIAAMAAAVVLENIDAVGRRWSAASALLHVCLVTGLGWWLVPAAGAAGAVIALVFGELIRAGFMRSMIAKAVLRHRRPSAGEPSPTPEQPLEENDGATSQDHPGAGRGHQPGPGTTSGPAASRSA